MASVTVPKHKADAAQEMEQVRALQFANLERHDWSDNVVFCGTKEALRSSGLIPNGTLFPDECEAKRGVRWRSDTGRRFVISKGWGPEGSYRLTIFATPAEQRQSQNAARVAREVEKVDRSIRELDVSEAQFRESMRRMIPFGWRALRDGELGFPWTYAPHVMEALQERFDEIHMLLTAGDLVRKPEAVNALKARKAALEDDQLQDWMLKLNA